NKLSDRFAAARATQLLVDQAKANGVPASSIRDAFGGRFQRYAAGRITTLEEAQERQRAGKLDLQRDLNNYLKLAQVLAPMANIDIDEAMISVARATSFWSRPLDETDGPETETDIRADRLALLFNAMVDGLLQEHRLKDFFRRARRTPGQLGIHTGRIENSAMPCVFREAYDGWNEHWQEAPLFPRAPLIWLPHSRSAFHVRLSEATISEPEGQWVPEGTVINGPVVAIDFCLFREVSLVIGPRTSLKNLGGLFESRAMVVAEMDGVDGRIPVRPQVELMDRGWLLLEDGWHFYELENADAGQDAEWALDPLAPEPEIFPHWYLSWAPVDGPHVRHWLEKAPEGSLIPSRPEATEMPEGESWYQKGSAAHEVEAGLAGG
ncbi:MAG: hypothetical protein RIC82_07370, partial [Parvibaculum sp.]